MRLASPQPYEDLGHTADVGVRVRGATAEEALARHVLAFAALATEALVPAACEIVRMDADGVEARVAFGRRDPERHAEGADLKAVTWHAARLEREGDGWVAQAVFDI